MPVTPRKKTPGRETYHHGNLRRALIDAALRLVAEGGPDAFTMAEAAREAGVSSGAPYRHFPDRKSLMTAVAKEAEELLGERLGAAAEQGGDGWTQLLALGRAQLAFAIEQPSYYRVLCSPEYRDPEDEGGIEEIAGNVERMTGAGRSREGAVGFAAQIAIYGLARMVVDGQLGPSPSPEALDGALVAALSALRRPTG